MPLTEEKIKVTDSKGFVYEVLIKHTPHHGFSTAYYEGDIIGQVELGKIHEPLGDDDREWEMYEERFDEWTCEIKYNMTFICKEHFDIINQPCH